MLPGRLLRFNTPNEFTFCDRCDGLRATPNYFEGKNLCADCYEKRQDEINRAAAAVECLRCGYVWTPRHPPRFCAGCKSSLWNKPRKYYSPESNAEPTAKRTAPTGRAAAARKTAENKIRAKKNFVYQRFHLDGSLTAQSAREFEQSESFRKCEECGTADKVFYSALKSYLCEECETKRQETFFQI